MHDREHRRVDCDDIPDEIDGVPLMGSFIIGALSGVAVYWIGYYVAYFSRAGC